MTTPADICLVTESGGGIGGVETWIGQATAALGDELDIRIARVTTDRSALGDSILDPAELDDPRVAERIPEARCYHALSSGDAGAAALLASTRHRSPMVVTEHGLAWHEASLQPAELESGQRLDHRENDIERYRARSRRILDAAALVTTVSAQNRHWQRRFAGVESTVIHNPARRTRVDTQGDDEQPATVDGAPTPDPIVAMVARVTPIKDVLGFVRAASLVQHARATFRVIGPLDHDPSYSQRCIDEARRLGLGGRFEFVGAADPEQWYPHLSLLVSNSVSEGSPYAVIDALARGVPVVATDVGGVGELVHGRHGDAGTLCRPGRPRELAAHIDAALSSPSHRTRFRVAALANVAERHDPDRVWDTYRGIYQRTLTGEIR